MQITLTLGLFLTLSSSLFAQNQPPEAVNQQDEVITIPLAEGQSADEAIRILRSSDKFETNNYITEVIELRNVTAYEMKPFIDGAVAPEKGLARAVKTKPTDGSAPRYFFLITTTPTQMPTILESIRELDVEGFVNRQGRSRAAVRTQYRRASELGDLLRATRMTGLAKVVADDATNTLYYDESEYVMGAVESYLQFYDVPIPQIEFDVQIVEVREDDVADVGLDWHAWKRSIGGQFNVSGNYFEGGEAFARLDGLLTLDASVLANFLNYTVQQGNASIVQRSRLNASNLQPAIISDVRRVPYVDYTRSERDPEVVTETNPRVDTYTEYERDDQPSGADRVVTIVPPQNNRLVDLSEDQEGLLISIAPVITTETVRAQIDIALNTVTGFDSLDKPIVTEQDLTNQFTLKNREELLLGTLERRRVVESRRGIPGLMDVPWLRVLFSAETSRTERSRLFILATPHFSNTGFDAMSLSELGSRPVLRHESREAVLEDGGLDRAAERFESPNP